MGGSLMGKHSAQFAKRGRIEARAKTRGKEITQHQSGAEDDNSGGYREGFIIPHGHDDKKQREQFLNRQ
jgi:hypothetical protein